MGVLFLCFLAVTAGAQVFGDNLGNHIATKNLNMSGTFSVVNAAGVAIGTSIFLNSSIALQVDAPDKAILIPRIPDTASIALPVNGMLVYSLSNDSFYVRQGGQWVTFGRFANNVTTLNSQVGDIRILGDNVGIKMTNNAGTNDWIISANYTVPIWNAKQIMGNAVSGVVPVNGHVLMWDGPSKTWKPSYISTLNNLVLSNGLDKDSIVTTLNGALRKIASSDILFIKDTSVMLSNLLKVSDTASMLSGYVLKGSGGGAAGVTSVSVATANGVSGTVANPTTTPAITLTLGAITPTSITTTGAVSAGTLSGTFTGNAGSATKLATARNINGVAFDGTTDITIVAGTSATVNANVLLGTTLASNVVNSSLTSVGTLAGLTVTNPINGTITGNAGSATKLATARNINGVAFDGTTDITIVAGTSATVNANALLGTTLASNVVNSSLTSVGTLAGLTVTNPINGTITGNAGSATKLATARNINGVAFDGTTDITITAGTSATVNANALTGTTIASNVVNSSLTSVGTLTNLTVTNPISGTITGNAGTATALKTARNIQGVSFDGTTDINPISGTGFVKSSGTTLSYDNSTYLTSAGAVTSITGTANQVTASASTGAVTLSLPATITGLTSVTSTGFTGALTGNASSATKLATARNINTVAFDGTTDITVTAAAGTLTGATLASNVLNSSLTSVGTLTNLTVTNPISGTITGNAGTATKLATARNIQSVSFDGTTDINVINGTGFVKSTGTTLSYDNSTYLTSAGAVTSLTGTANQVTASASTGAVTLSLPATITGLTSVTSTGFTGALTGNASTATKLATARNINTVAFDGTTDITVTAAAGTLTGATLASNVVSSSLTSVGTLTNLTVTNPISGTITGNAGTATKLATARNIQSVSFDGTTDINVINGTGFVKSTGTTLSYDNSTYLTSAGAVTSLTGTANQVTASASTGAVTLSLPATITGLTSVTSTGFTGALTGNASTATKLATARNINNVAFDGTTDITITAVANAALTIGNSLVGTSYNGSSAVTVRVDTAVSISTRLHGDSVAMRKLNTADTASMLGGTSYNSPFDGLSGYARYGNVVKYTDTANMLHPGGNGYMKYSDTAHMLSTYTITGNVVNVSDTGYFKYGGSVHGMLFPYMRTYDTTAMLSNYRGSTSIYRVGTITTGTWNAGTITSTGLTVTGGAVSLNSSSNFNTDINTGTSTGTVTIGGTGAQTINVGTGGTGIKTIGIGTGAIDNVITIGTVTGAASLTEKVGTGNYSLDGAAASTYTIGASTVGGTIAIGGTAQTGAITLGSSSAAQTVNVGTGAGASTVNIANGLAGNTIAIANGANTSAQTINIGAGASAANNTINIGSGTSTAGVTAVTIGTTTGAASLTEKVGTGNYSLNGAAASTYTIGASTVGGTIAIGGTAQTGSITLGSSSGAQTLNLGTGAGASTVNIANGLAGNTIAIANGANTSAQAINIGAGASAANNTINIGSGTNTAGVTTVSIGSSAALANTLTLEAGTGNITIGNSANARTWNVGAGNAIQTVNLFNNATPANVISIGGAASTTTIGSVKNTIGIAGTTNGNGLRIGNSRISINHPVAPISSAGGSLTPTASDIFDAGIFVYTATGNFTFPTAASLVAAMPGTPAVGDVFTFTIVTTGSWTATLITGTGITIGSATTTANRAQRVIYCYVTNVTGGSEAITVY